MHPSSSPLAEMLIATAPRTLAARLDADRLGPQLEDRYHQGRAAWPSLEVSRSSWAGHLAKHLAPQVERGLEHLHPDFYFAVALVENQPAALALFVSHFRPKLTALLSRGGAAAVAEDVVATVEARLLTGPDRAITKYSGRGSLERFLSAVVSHQLLNTVRGKRPQTPLTDQLVEQLVTDDAGPELAAVIRDARRVFGDALHSAFRALSSKERLLLRMSIVERTTLEQLGALYGVHKVTAFRWLEEAKLQLKNGTRKVLRDVHALSETEIDSLLGGASSLEASLRTMFASVEPQRSALNR